MIPYKLNASAVCNYIVLILIFMIQSISPIFIFTDKGNTPYLTLLNVSYQRTLHAQVKGQSTNNVL